ncbi:energy transducer TonB [Pontibacter silvestris]|uniref:Energy transducer TonB n=1 Tax=Pontibacter silvestris TaxID=2305183 RepID=A0ABW4WRF9_9BACT|nr:energy transducer TonB [Pontibacter silvestris]MCC9138161.1 energy transducer TonB [Pontibacter silvestris]
MPVYKQGGEMGMLEFIEKNLKYPSDKNLNGIVVTSFVVSTTNEVTDPVIIKSLSTAAHEETRKPLRDIRCL